MSSCADPIVGLPEQARGGDLGALGRLLEGYRDYLTLLGRVQIGRRLRGKVDDADLVQETFLEAHRSFARFRGSTEAELAAWLRQILAARITHLLRRYIATGYTGTVHLTSSDRQARLPSDYTFAAADQGQHVFTITLLTPGMYQTLTVRAKSNPAIAGTAEIFVNYPFPFP